MNGDAVDLLSTCPPRKFATDGRSYLDEVIDVARWSEQARYKGILVYTANAAQADPWVLAQVILQHTRSITPLVAVQPVYMHPYTVAKLVASLSILYCRRIDLNMVAGGFKTELASLNDDTPHDERYARLTEYTAIVMRLLANPDAITSSTGRFYKVDHLRLEPALPKDLLPRIFMSGSSDAGVKAARETGALAMRYPARGGEVSAPAGLDGGIRVGVIAREDDDHAWQVALKRFPPDRKGQVTHMLAMRATDSVWHKQLSAQGADGDKPDRDHDLYWLGPFENYQEYCPYLVGSYVRVAKELARYVAAGNRTFILDVPPDGAESVHVNRAFALAVEYAEVVGPGT
jgi:alkanesulfonate monooxygenase